MATLFWSWGIFTRYVYACVLYTSKATETPPLATTTAAAAGGDDDDDDDDDDDEAHLVTISVILQNRGR